MSKLRVYQDTDPGDAIVDTSDTERIVDVLASAGVRFENWDATREIRAGDSEDEVLAAYRGDIDRLIAAEGYQTVDVISLTADHPEKETLRRKFLDEHTHSEDEVRFFVDGQGLFSLHIDDSVYEVLCEKGDLIGVPANTPHWFDMGPNPEFVAIRFFNNPEGWVARFTGSAIADSYSRLEN